VYGFDESLRFELKKLGKTGVKTTCVVSGGRVLPV
jgi:hypothetical protein